jgi:hypothetical protein
MKTYKLTYAVKVTLSRKINANSKAQAQVLAINLEKQIRLGMYLNSLDGKICAVPVLESEIESVSEPMDDWEITEVIK